VQNPLRVVDDSLGTTHPSVPTGSAIAGQNSALTVPNFNNQTCLGCHLTPTGSDATQIFEVFSGAPRTTSLEIAHLRQLQHRSLETEMIALPGSTTQFKFNRNGYGALHNGVEPTLFDFIFNTGVFQPLTPPGLVNTFRFVEQFDQGISPAVHWAGWYDSNAATTTNMTSQIKAILLDAADRGWNDAVAIGRFDTGSGLVPMRWVYVNGAQRFESDTPGVGSVTWARMVQMTTNGQAEHVFIGVPIANGKRFGIDHDRDGIINGGEAAAGTSEWDPDFDLDGWPDGYETAHGDDPLVAQATSSDGGAPTLASSQLDFANSRLAKYHVQFREDVKYTVTYSTSGGPVRTFTRDYFSTSDTFVLTHEEPSTPDLSPFGVLGTPITLNFGVSISFVDRNGNAGVPVTLSQFQPTNAMLQIPLPLMHVKGMQWLTQSKSGSTLTATARITIDFNYGAPAFNLAEAASQMVFSNLAVLDPVTGNFVKATNFTSTNPTTIVLDTAPTASFYTVDPGPPWVTSTLTTNVGEADVNFVLNGLSAGQEVKLSVMGILSPSATLPGAFDPGSGVNMQPLLTENTMELSTIF
jgi:hypothetical protein